MYESMNLSDRTVREIFSKRDAMLASLFYNEFFIVLYEEPEGTPRPRFRLINRRNIGNAAMSNGSFVQVYSITGAEDQRFMKRLISDNDFMQLNQQLCTPLEITYDAFFKTPSGFNRVDTVLAELGLIRPLTKPDWDNIGKKYSDMYNSNIWLDDSFVISGTVNKFYSILPRVEIRLKYLNMVYNRYQYNAIRDRILGEVDYFKGE
jgi:Holliday junction resolvase RusA-like endonuclease